MRGISRLRIAPVTLISLEMLAEYLGQCGSNILNRCNGPFCQVRLLSVIIHVVVEPCLIIRSVKFNCKWKSNG